MISVGQDAAQAETSTAAERRKRRIAELIRENENIVARHRLRKQAKLDK